MDYTTFGYLRIAAIAPDVKIGNPHANAERLLEHVEALAGQEVAIVLFPELCLTGYSAEDLFRSQALHRDVKSALADIAQATAQNSTIVVVGLPWQLDDGRLLNCAAVVAHGAVKGMVPKGALPNYGEFYDQRWFVSGAGVDQMVTTENLGSFRVSDRQIFRAGHAQFAIEVCEDLWAPQPPHGRLCLAGADVILNPSASNELVAKADYRRDLVRMASAAGISGYLYASCGPGESTKDVVFGGHLIAAENGQVVGESERHSMHEHALIAEFDVQALRHDRAANTTFAGAARPAPLTVVDCATNPSLHTLTRSYTPSPFVPNDEQEFAARAQEILAIQSTGLARRVQAAGNDNLVIGVSGGLDSTLAFLVCLDALAKLKRDNTHLLALTLPGPGTTGRTLESARALAKAVGAPLQEIAIDPAVKQHLADLQHNGDLDVVFENAQARERTQLLFNYANQHAGIVVGTGDLSELALGWCTFNADHMANYNVNASVPKTMVAYLVRWYLRHRADPPLAAVLERVLETPISPELLPPEAGADGEISQKTEAIVGPYALHDFFLYHFLRHGFSPTKIFHLARASFAGTYPAREIRQWLRVFFQRFFTQQFKRTTLPPGPKVGTVSLSPRGDWRMPDEASVEHLLAEIDQLPAD